MTLSLLWARLKGTIVNFGFRSGSILAKFLLIVYISKVMSLETLGVYNIIAVTVAWSVYVLGFEFYSYSLRQIVGEKENIVAGYVFNQLIFHGIAFLALVTISPLFIYFNFIPKELIIYFLAITLFDQLSQECYRICVALDRSQFANLIHFVKSGLWVLPLMAFPLMGIDITVNLILGAWLAGNILSLLIGAIKLASLDLLKIKSSKLNVRWIVDGIKVALPFVVISMAQITMDFSDRYLIDFYLGKTEVGVYSFFYGIANVPITLITSVLVAPFYSKVINLYKFESTDGDKRKLIKDFITQNLVFAGVISVVSIGLIYPLLNFVDKPELSSRIGIFYLMLVQVIIFSVQVVGQTMLYARYQDRFLLYSAIGGAILNIIINLVLLPRMGLPGAVLATIVAMAAMTISRVLLLRKLNMDGSKKTI